MLRSVQLGVVRDCNVLSACPSPKHHYQPDVVWPCWLVDHHPSSHPLSVHYSTLIGAVVIVGELPQAPEDDTQKR